MPTVPRAPGRQVDTAPLPAAGSRATAGPATFGAGIGRATQQAGDALAQQAREARDKALRARLNDKDLQLGQEQIELESEVRRSELEGAFAAGDKARSRFKERVAELRQDIPTDIRDAYDAAAGRRQLGLDRSIESHVSRESQRLEEITFQAHDELSKRAIADNYRDPMRVLSEIPDRASRLRERLESRNVPAKAIQAAVEENVSESHSIVVEQHLAAGDDIFAGEYFDVYKGEMIPKDRDRLRPRLEVGSRLGEAQRIADEIIGSDISLEEAREQWRQIEDPELRDMVQQRVEREFGLRDRAAQERKGRLFETAHDLISATGGDVEFLSSWLTDLDANQTEALRRHQANLTASGPKQNDNRVWTQLATMDRQQWAGMSQQQILAFEPYLDQSHYDRALTMWKEARDPVSGTPTLTFKDRVDTAVREMPFFDFDDKPSKWSEEQSEFYAIFETATAREVAEFENRIGRKASPEELQSIIDGMTRTALRVPRASTGPIVWTKHADIALQRAALNAAGLDPLGPTLDQIPPATRDGIENRLRGNGRTVTPDKVERFYAAMLQGDEDAGQRILEEP